MNNATSVNAEGSYRVGKSTISVQGSLTTPFENLKTGSLEGSLDLSSNKAMLLLQRNDHVFRMDGKAKFESEQGKLELGLSENEVKKHALIISYDRTLANDSKARLSLIVNEVVMYEADSQLVSNDQNGQLMIAFKTASEEVMKLDAKYDNSESMKTAMIFFGNEEKHYQVMYEAKLMNDSLTVSVNASNPMKSHVSFMGQFNNSQATKSAQVIINYEDEMLEWTATADHSTLKGMIQSQVNNVMNS